MQTFTLRVCIPCLRKITDSTFLCASTIILSCGMQGPVDNYTAILTGDKMVPPLNTSAHGEVAFSIHHHIHSKDDTAAYTITLFQVNHLIEVDLRQAHEGQPGDKIATLWGPSPNGLGQVSDLFLLMNASQL